MPGLPAGSCSDFLPLSDSDISKLGTAVQGGGRDINSVSLTFLRLLLLLLLAFVLGFFSFALFSPAHVVQEMGVTSLVVGILSRVVAKWGAFVFR